MQRIAAIDTGSNAIRLMVAGVDDARQIHPLENIRIPVRLGQDVFSRSRLSEKTIQLTIDAFAQFRRIINDFGVVTTRAVGTSAVREAENRDVLIERIALATGIDLEVIDGDEEARLVYLAVADAMDLGEKRTVMVDIGGGSVEVTSVKDGRIISTSSYYLGTVRLLQKMNGESATHSPKEFSRLVRESAEAVQRRIKDDLESDEVDRFVGTGGNVEALADLRDELLNEGRRGLITLKELDGLIEKLSQLSYQERITWLDLRPDRADVILPAAIVLRMIAGVADVREVHIPYVGLKNGLLLDMARNLGLTNQLPDRDQAWASAVRLGHKYHFDLPHASLVAKLACSIFDQTTALHKMDGEERILLEIGSLLHDIGHFINTVDHDQHGYYLLTANHLIGLRDRQQEMVACMAGLHRKGFPFQEGSYARLLDQKDRLVVIKLISLLRLADSLDAGHAQRVEDVTIRPDHSTWRLEIMGSEDLSLERWAAMKRRALFQEFFGVDLEIA